jgi:hypothetical protein
MIQIEFVGLLMMMMIRELRVRYMRLKNRELAEDREQRERIWKS